MSIFNTTDPSDIDAINEQVKRDAEEQEAKQREAEQEQLDELAAQSALSKKKEKTDVDSPLQPEIESGLRNIFG